MDGIQAGPRQVADFWWIGHNGRQNIVPFIPMECKLSARNDYSLGSTSFEGPSNLIPCVECGRKLGSSQIPQTRRTKTWWPSGHFNANFNPYFLSLPFLQKECLFNLQSPCDSSICQRGGHLTSRLSWHSTHRKLPLKGKQPIKKWHCKAIQLFICVQIWYSLLI